MLVNFNGLWLEPEKCAALRKMLLRAPSCSGFVCRGWASFTEDGKTPIFARFDP